MNKKVEIEVSARHVHLSKKDYDFLFGSDTPIEKIKELSQIGEYSTNKIVRLVGPKGEVTARLIYPFRNESQAEISLTDCIKIGIPATFAVHVSEGGSRIQIIGDSGEIIRNSAIVAKRHLHVGTKEAQLLKLQAGQTVRAIVQTKRGTIDFHNIVVEIAANFQLRVHLDTDEGNAAGISGKEFGELIL